MILYRRVVAKMNTIRELTQQEKYDTMLKRKNREIKSLKEQLELLVKDDEKYQETIIRQSKIINNAIERITWYTNQFDNFSDKDLITNRVIDIEILYELLDILKGNDTK